MTARHLHLHRAEHETGGIDALSTTGPANQVALVRNKSGGGMTNAMYRLSDMTVISGVPAAQTQYYAFPILQPNAADSDFGTPGQLYDPNGWIRTTSLVETFWWNKTFPAYTVLSLPAGFYLWTMRWVLLGTSPTDQWDVFFDQIGDYSTTFTTHVKEDYPFRRMDGGVSKDGDRLSGEEQLNSGCFYFPNPAMCVPVLQMFANVNARNLATLELAVTRVTS